MEHYFVYDTCLGKIGIAENGTAITRIFFESCKREDKMVFQETPLIRKMYEELNEFCEGGRKCFDLPLAPSGTKFQEEVWKALQSIPYGETRSYKEIAVQIGNEKACRAVGMANNKNPIAIAIPCHRVIGANGKMVGYGGGLDKKNFLLDLENNSFE